MKKIVIYTDGACSGNPGPGGWGAILIYNEYKKEVSGGESYTTNNRMELTAAIEALKIIKEPCAIDIYTDSAYLCNAFSAGWLNNWSINGWKTAKKESVQNRDLWETLLKLCSIHDIRWHKVKGHSTNEFNNRCDELARSEIKRLAK